MLKETYSPTNGYILCDTHEWWPGKAKSTHITQREQEHKSGTLEELSCSYQAEKQTSLQRTLQRVTQILQQHPLTHALFSQGASNFIQQRSGVHSTGVDFPPKKPKTFFGLFDSTPSLFDYNTSRCINQGLKAMHCSDFTTVKWSKGHYFSIANYIHP